MPPGPQPHHCFVQLFTKPAGQSAIAGEFPARVLFTNFNDSLSYDLNFQILIYLFIWKKKWFWKYNLYIWKSTNQCFKEMFLWAFLGGGEVLTFKRWHHPTCLPPSGGAGKARFNVATPTYEARTRPLHVQHTYYRIIFKQNPFNIISRGVQRWTSTDFRLK